MSQTYRATGINLKAIPMGETDRLITILSPEFGLIRGIAPGSRKYKSRLGGRSDLFVINDWLIVKGKRLDKFVQAETRQTFPGLSQHLGKLTASQYLAEMVMMMALSDCPQADLFHLFVEHLERIEALPPGGILAALCHGVYHLLALAGVAPEVHRCCTTRVDIVPNFLDVAWQVHFSPEAGGLVLPVDPQPGPIAPGSRSAVKSAVESEVLTHQHRSGRAHDSAQSYRVHSNRAEDPLGKHQLSALHVALLQQLSKPELITTLPTGPTALPAAGAVKAQDLWARIERLLREYAEHYFERSIRSATLVDVCMATV